MRKRFADIIRSFWLAKCLVVFLVSVGVLFADPTTTLPQTAGISEKPKSLIALPGEKCRVDPLDEWPEPEKWAWTCICEGKNADFNERLGEKLNPIDPHEWSYDNRWSTAYKWSDGRRTLSTRFLRTILIHEPFRSAIPHEGVHIVGAYFKDEIALRSASIERSLMLKDSLFESLVDMSRLKTSKFISFEGSKFDAQFAMDSASIGSDLRMNEKADFGEVTLKGAKIGGQLDMSDSTFKGTLDLDSASIGSDLRMNEKADFGEVILQGAKIGGQLDMSDSTFKGTLEMGSVSIGSNLLMGRQAEFGEVFLEGAKIVGQLNMSGSTFKGLLIMDSVLIGRNLFMSQKAEFSEVILKGAKIEGQLDMSSSTFKSDLSMNAISIGKNLFMEEAEFGEVVLDGAKIGGQISMSNSTFRGELNMKLASIGSDLVMGAVNFHKPAKLRFLRVGYNLDARGLLLSGLDLTGARIDSELRLGALRDKEIEWRGYAPKLSLRNTSVGVLRDTRNAWPPHLELDGFTYKRLGTSRDEAPVKRKSEWYVKWLEKSSANSPQPYLYLARVLRAAGYEEMADDILYESLEKQREKSEMWGWLRLSVLKVTIGYGYGWRYFRALGWVAGLMVLGMVILLISLENENEVQVFGFWNSAFYSLDMLLPVIRLRDLHYEEVDLVTWARYYFYFHKIMGYVLIFFVLAGLSGLMK